MIDLEKLLLCEYSEKQHCFHIVNLSKALQMNANGILHHYGLDFIPFALTDSYGKANAICDEMLERMTKAKKANTANRCQPGKTAKEGVRHDPSCDE